MLFAMGNSGDVGREATRAGEENTPPAPWRVRSRSRSPSGGVGNGSFATTDQDASTSGSLAGPVSERSKADAAMGSGRDRGLRDGSVHGSRGGGGGLLQGGEVRRLVRKVGALVRDHSSSCSLEAFQVEEARLLHWVRLLDVDVKRGCC